MSSELSTRAIQLRLLHIAETCADPSLLLQAGFKLRHPELFDAACSTFGSWEAVLTELIFILRNKELFLQPQEAQHSQELSIHNVDTVPRERSEDAEHPLFGLTTMGELICIPGEELITTHQPVDYPLDTIYGMLQSFTYKGTMSDVFAFTNRGLYYGIIRDFVPSIHNQNHVASLLTRLDVQDGESIQAIATRRELDRKEYRLIHVTQFGKGKATNVKEYTQHYEKQGREAFLLKDGDQPVSVLIGKEFNGLFCASAQGQGIHMDAGELRTMGRKSVGVNVMKLNGEHDRIVSAFLTEGVEQLALITAQGYGKRIAFKEFRRQGRGGSGMQTLRLNTGDSVVSVQPVSPEEDIILTSTQGRVWRLPADWIPEMGRAARGKRIFELRDDEHVLGLSVVPCGGAPQHIHSEGTVSNELESNPVGSVEAVSTEEN